MPLRIALAVVAAALTGWLGVQLVDAWRLHEGTEVAYKVGRPPTPAEIHHADGLLRSAGFAFDRQRRLARAFLLSVHARRPEAAIPMLLALTRAEPQNSDAWALLATVSAASHPRLAARAGAHERELVPRVLR